MILRKFPPKCNGSDPLDSQLWGRKKKGKGKILVYPTSFEVWKNNFMVMSKK
jgi:hypothetical protein